MITKATLRYIRISPRKIRPVIDLIKGKKAEDAISTLYSVKKRASGFLIDLIESAISNAKRMPGIDVSNLYVSSLVANGGPQMKRFRAASMGRASSIRKRTSHVTVELDQISIAQNPGDVAAIENKKNKVAKAPKKIASKADIKIKKPKAKESAKLEAGKKGKE